jgi:hypothetical protein
LIREAATIDASWHPINSAAVRNELGTILYAMTTLASRFPILGKPSRSISDDPILTPPLTAISTAKIQKRLAEL